jgi:hypothetical protein
VVEFRLNDWGWAADTQNMPLACLDDNDGLLDSTALSDADWAGVHRVTPRARLVCRFCETRMQAKVSKGGLRFFAHDRRTPECPSEGETPEHRRLKSAVANDLRAAGWSAEVEADGGSWRADVLGTTPGGDRRVAFEVQLAAMTVDDGRYRTDRYADDGVETVWVTSKVASWFFEIPSLQVTGDATVLDVSRGCLKRKGLRDWETPEPFAFVKFAGALASGKLVVRALRSWHHEDLPRGQSAKTRRRRFDDPVAWVKPADWDAEVVAQAKSDVEAEAEERESERRRERHERRTRDLHERQQRLAPLVVEAVRKATGLGVFAGDPRGQGNAPKPSGDHAFGIPVFVKTKGVLRLCAVVCPIASQIEPWDRDRWKAVTVFVDSEAERVRLVNALHNEVRVQMLRSSTPSASGHS